MRCNNCGSENRDDAKFCRSCGAPLTQQKSRGRRPLHIAALITVFAISATVAVMLFLHRSPIPNGAKPVDKGAARGSILVLEDKTELLRNEDDGRSIIAAHQEDLGVGNVADMLGSCRIETIGDNTFYRYSLEVDSIPIYGRSIVLAADGDERLCAITSGAINMGNCQTVPEIDDLDARDALAKETGISGVYASDLVFYCDDGISPTLAYELAYIDGENAGQIFVSASDGSIVGQSTSILALQGDGRDIHATNRTFEVASILEVSDRGEDIPVTSQGFYALVDLSRNLYVYDANGDDLDKVIATMEVSTKSARYHLLPAKSEPGYTWQGDQENEVDVVGHFGKSDSWIVRKADGSEEQVDEACFSYVDQLVTSTTTTVDAPPAVTLMSSLSSIYDFYASKDSFGHEGFDDWGGRVNAVCNVNMKNACGWAPAGRYAQIVCGEDHDYLAHVVIAHEYAHTVQASICELSGIGESGSLQEGTSDVLGILACDYADNGKMDNSAEWKLFVRDLINPESMGDPSKYMQEGLWADTIPQYDKNRRSTNDFGGVHQNSTVLSHAAYLMCDKEAEIGGKALTTMELGTLVMNSFQLVSNPDCDFAEFAGYMNCMARENLSHDKWVRVEEAFEAVEIEPWIVALIDSRDAPPDNTVHTTEDGTYTLSGTVHVHEEDFGGQRTDSVVSLVLDEDVPYEYEYKGAVQAVAHEVLLSTTGSEAFGASRFDEWAKYDGQRITVECDGLQGAHHDASYWKVDTIATGKIRLLSSSSQPISDTSDSEDEYTIHLTGANLVLPEALRGKVDLTVTNNGFEDQVEYAGCGWFLAWNTDTTWVDEWRASGGPSDYADVSSETLPDGTQLIFGYGNDLICQVEIIDPEGNKGVLVTSGFEKDFCVYVLGMNEDQVTACRELQDAVTGGSADDSSVDNAFAFLRECAKGLTFTDG